MSSQPLAVMVSPETRNEAWIAHVVGAAWARGIPVVPILVGEWKVDVPNILAPYQQFHWNTQQERIVDQLVAMIDLTPREMPVQEAEEAAGAIRPEVRKKSNGKCPAGGRKKTANRKRG